MALRVLRGGHLPPELRLSVWSTLLRSSHEPLSHPYPFCRRGFSSSHCLWVEKQSPVSKQQPPAPETPTIAHTVKERRAPLFLVSLIALSAGIYITLLTISFIREPLPPCGCPDNNNNDDNVTGRPPELDAKLATLAASPHDQEDPLGARIAAIDFDRELDRSEVTTGIRSLRTDLTAQARGHVLEVAIGTGRNLPFYAWDAVTRSEADEAARQAARAHFRSLVPSQSTAAKRAADKDLAELRSLTAVDISVDMLLVARQHLRAAVPGLDRIMRRKRKEPLPTGPGIGLVVDVLGHRLRLVKADAQEALPMAPDIAGPLNGPSDGRYDTVIQSFGLCSVPDPVRLLAGMATVLRPDTGRIFLLEHGRGNYNWLNRHFLDRFAAKHFQKYGCWWNRDIEAIIKEAAARVPGLEIVKLERPIWTHFGTTIMVELKVNSRESVEATES